jgi:hypothetical protein
MPLGIDASADPGGKVEPRSKAPHRGGANLSPEEVRAALQGYRDRIAEIDAMIPPGTYLVHGAGDRASEAASHLKSAVKSCHKRPASSRQSMSEVERLFFDPCMHRVFVALQKLRINTDPGPKWKSALFVADTELDPLAVSAEQVEGT